MDKSEFIALIKEFKDEIKFVANQCSKIGGTQIQQQNLLNTIEITATKWFDSFEPHLRNDYHFGDELLERYRILFGKLLELSEGRPSIKLVNGTLKLINFKFHTEILVPVQKFQSLTIKYPQFDSIKINSSGLEEDYLNEAIECARYDNKRASIIMGWCAAIDRLHLFIEKIGFDKFNTASNQMKTIQTGRYKRFNKKFEIQNLTELRMSVFDKDLLWILEFLCHIDGNQHEKLEICLTMRNTCAHPGENLTSDENILSFFSDINNLIFSNPKFNLK